jgi:glycosyltransferase involved in cell wall biosynthesis
VASRVSVPARIPLALSLHGTDVRLIGKNPIVRALAGGVFRRTSLVLPVSPALGRELDRLALPVRAREILPMPADPTVFRPGDAEREAPSSARFVVAARLTAQKRVDLALRALARVRQRGLLVRLDIAGDGPERARLSSLARSLGLEGSVLFHGVLSPPELAQLFRQSAAVVLPSEREGYGLVIVEGALCGIPAIGARSGGIEDLIESGATGLLFRPGDVEELASALERLATRFDEARRMGAEACRLAQARTPEPIAERLAGLYGRMIDRPELRPG